MDTRARTVSDEEDVTRFLLQKSWIRKDKTVRQDAFIPPSDLKLSVTRHNNLSEAEIWGIGQKIASTSSRSLYGRADIQTALVRFQKLDIEPDPVPANSNHAIITGWPNDKPTQKIMAAELAAASQFAPMPE